MPLAPRAPRYTAPAVALHWLMAALIVTALVLGWYMADLPFSPSRVRLFNYHKWLGVSILALAGGRLLWRLFRRPPALPSHLPRWQARSAHAVHGLLNALFFAVPLTGWSYSSAAGFPIVWFGVLPLPDWVSPDQVLAKTLENVHAWVAYALAAVVALHVAAAFRHAATDGPGSLRRMWFGRS